jgi:hypothetical protein
MQKLLQDQMNKIDNVNGDIYPEYILHPCLISERIALSFSSLDWARSKASLLAFEHIIFKLTVVQAGHRTGTPFSRNWTEGRVCAAVAYRRYCTRPRTGMISHAVAYVLWRTLMIPACDVVLRRLDNICSYKNRPIKPFLDSSFHIFSTTLKL